MFATLDFAPSQLPDDAPRYLMGVGKPDDLVGAVERGVDMFDCVLPTRSGRNGQAFTWDGPMNLRNARFAEDTDPLDSRCACPTCATYSRAYLHHLIKSGEMLGAMLLTEHNIGFYQQLMQAMRDAIAQDRFRDGVGGNADRDGVAAGDFTAREVAEAFNAAVAGAGAVVGVGAVTSELPPQAATNKTTEINEKKCFICQRSHKS